VKGFVPGELFHTSCCCGLREMKFSANAKILPGAAGLGALHGGWQGRAARSSWGAPGQPQLWASGISLGTV